MANVRTAQSVKTNPACRIVVSSREFLWRIDAVKSKKVNETNPNAKTLSQRRRRQASLLRESIKLQRKLAGLTRGQLAERANVPISTVVKAEIGALGTVSWKDLYAIGVALGVSISLQREAKTPEGTARPLSESLETVDTPEGKDRVKTFLAEQPYPHYQPAKGKPGLLVRIDANGKRTIGRFINRKFQPDKHQRANIVPK